MDGNIFGRRASPAGGLDKWRVRNKRQEYWVRQFLNESKASTAARIGGDPFRVYFRNLAKQRRMLV